MKKLHHISPVISIIIILLLSLSKGLGQTIHQAYYFDGDEVVFVFDDRNYDKAVEEGNSKYLDFSDLDIYEVAISGDFNAWSMEGWKMKRKNKHVFELRKKVEDFQDPFEWEYRYIINGRHLVEEIIQLTNSKMYNKEFLKDAFDIDVNQIDINQDGQVLFFLRGHTQAKEVILTGSFNGWDEHEITMDRTNDGWELKADLNPGTYEYKFIVDGEWMHDPDNPRKKRNEYLTFNSIMEVTQPVTFILDGFTNAEQVILAGSFNDWNENKTRMKKTEKGWKLTLQLPGGKHYYKFIVDGVWYTDPSNPLVEDDGRGNVNSVRIVR